MDTMTGPTVEEPLRRWAASGAMSLCGPVDGPACGPPGPLVGVLDDVARSIAEDSAAIGRRVQLDPLRVLTERAAIAGLRRRGTISCGGATRLLPARDGWLALTLARPDDIDLVPAWLGIDLAQCADDPWPAVEAAVADTDVRTVVDEGALLGLPVAAVGSVTTDDTPPVAEPVGEAPSRPLDDLWVVDLSSLWAGPLCGRILADAGARVVKVESTSRPDGARRGPPAFFDLMNGGKQSVALELASEEGRRTLAALVARADVVIEASRPRALAAMGIDALAATRTGPAVWLSITGYGRTGPGQNRVGFGDDTAAAGGAVVCTGDVPSFCGDAVADPITGMMAAAAVLRSLRSGGRWMLDIALARSAAAVAGPAMDAGGLEPAYPQPPVVPGRAVPLGADNDAVLRALAP